MSVPNTITLHLTLKHSCKMIFTFGNAAMTGPKLFAVIIGVEYILPNIVYTNSFSVVVGEEFLERQSMPIF